MKRVSYTSLVCLFCFVAITTLTATDSTIECVRDAVKVWINGDLVNHGADCTAKKGQIALQTEGTEFEFRKLELTPITELSD